VIPSSKYEYHSRTIYSVHQSTSGWLASGGADDAINIFKQFQGIEEPGKKQVFPRFSLACHVSHAHKGDVNCVAWNPVDSSILASGSDDNDIHIWRMESPPNSDTSIG